MYRFLVVEPAIKSVEKELIEIESLTVLRGWDVWLMETSHWEWLGVSYIETSLENTDSLSPMLTRSGSETSSFDVLNAAFSMKKIKNLPKN